jgi:hypothetical protein
MDENIPTNPQGQPATDQPTSPDTQEKVIETASATTSSERNRSGNAAYIIAVAVVAACLLLASGISSCVSAVFGAMVGSEYDSSSSNGYGNGYGSSSESDPDTGSLEDLLGGGSSEGQGADVTKESLTQENALYYDLYLYTYDISSEVAATDYSGATSNVSTYVRSIVSVDDEADTAVASHLNAAAKAGDDTDTVSSELASAAQVAEQATADLKAIQVPSNVSGSYASAITTNLTDAREKAIDRWTTISDIIAMTQSPDGKTVGDLYTADEQTNTDATASGEALVEALSLSAQK